MSSALLFANAYTQFLRCHICLFDWAEIYGLTNKKNNELANEYENADMVNECIFYGHFLLNVFVCEITF